MGGNVTFDNNLMSQAINSGYIMDTARDMVGGINLKYDFNKLVKGLSARFSWKCFYSKSFIYRT